MNVQKMDKKEYDEKVIHPKVFCHNCKNIPKIAVEWNPDLFTNDLSKEKCKSGIEWEPDFRNVFYCNYFDPDLTNYQEQVIRDEYNDGQARYNY